MKTLAILGSTGSIGRQTLDVVRAHPELFRVAALAAGNNVGLLAKQVMEFRPQWISSAVAPGPAGLPAQTCAIEELAALPEVDTVVIATSGNAGILPCMTALLAGKTVALANKEALVSAGEVMSKSLHEGGGKVLPLDSEHSAIWQCLQGETAKPNRIILTASGGPFRRYSLAQMAKVTPAQALKHPTWAMGRKITIDSATLMNKGMEVIEACWLFNARPDQVEVVIHPESIIHSMVEFADGSIKAQLSCPDMRIPIQYALTYPDRQHGQGVPAVDFKLTRSLTFEDPDLERFNCLGLAAHAARMGKTYPAALCAGDEVAVESFLQGRIGFLDIPRVVSRVLESHEGFQADNIDSIMEADRSARARAREIAGSVEFQRC
ncbi:MAG: 1-deoxy-D-xylulose-5-phosphate reductoisomerase [Chloroflexi bacterium]|nr:1-deoxy-D-xylulose-5-phosphate reductoisomerase [Chloroflexota bacterium]